MKAKSELSIEQTRSDNKAQAEKSEREAAGCSALTLPITGRSLASKADRLKGGSATHVCVGGHRARIFVAMSTDADKTPKQLTCLAKCARNDERRWDIIREINLYRKCVALPWNSEQD